MTYKEFSRMAWIHGDTSLFYDDVEILIRVIESSMDISPPHSSTIYSYRSIVVSPSINFFSSIPSHNWGVTIAPNPTAHVLMSSGERVACYIDSINVDTQNIEITAAADPSLRCLPMRQSCEIFFHIDACCFEDFPITKREFKTKKFTHFDRFNIMDFD